MEPIVGWRAWLVVVTREGLRLASVLYPTIWTPREEVVATCRPGADRPGHIAPDLQCGCGIYGSKRPDLATEYVHGHGHGGPTGRPLLRVMGTVSLWGKVIEGEHGFRASHAYPKRLYVPVNRIPGALRVPPAKVAYELMSAYRVEVEAAAIPRDGAGPILRPRVREAGTGDALSS
jgi:hypothetical protein